MAKVCWRAGLVPRSSVEPVTLTIEPQGKGRVGAVMEVAIVNNSDEPITLMASLILGDGRTAIVGRPAARADPRQGARRLPAAMSGSRIAAPARPVSARNQP